MKRGTVITDYRIVEEDGYFYPQIRGILWGWNAIHTVTGSGDYTASRLGSFDAARNRILREIEYREYTDYKKIHYLTE